MASNLPQFTVRVNPDLLKNFVLLLITMADLPIGKSRY